MDETIPTPCPPVIRNRVDAIALWKHLLTRNISFHPEHDPADWINVETREPTLTAEEADNIRRLFDEVAGLEDESYYEDAISLSKLWLLVGPEAVRQVPTELAACFQEGDIEVIPQRFARLMSRRPRGTTFAAVD